MLAIALIQLFFQVRTPNTFDVKIGFPFTFYYFSIDGNQLQGARLIGFLWDFIITFPFALAINLIIQFIEKKLNMKTPETHQVIDD